MIVPPPRSAPAPRASLLRRELGRWDLTAIGVNQVIGSAVFVMPAALAANAGAWSPWIVAAVGLGSMLIALSFAEVSSRFESTGGPYLYTRAAFGRPAAGKTGTNEEHKDAWFAGYTPDLATTVWIGFTKGEIPMENVHGIAGATELGDLGAVLVLDVAALIEDAGRRREAA